MSEDTTQVKEERTFTQTELDAKVQARVAEEKAKFKDYDSLKEKAEKFDKTVEESKTDLEKLTERATAAETKLAEIEQEKQLTEWRREARNEVKLDEKYDKYLIGSTLDEIKASAKDLAADLPKGSQRNVFTTDTGDVGIPPGSSSDLKELFKNMTGG